MWVSWGGHHSVHLTEYQHCMLGTVLSSLKGRVTFPSESFQQLEPSSLPPPPQSFFPNPCTAYSMQCPQDMLVHWTGTGTRMLSRRKWARRRPLEAREKLRRAYSWSSSLVPGVCSLSGLSHGWPESNWDGASCIPYCSTHDCIRPRWGDFLSNRVGYQLTAFKDRFPEVLFQKVQNHLSLHYITTFFFFKTVYLPPC